MCASSFVTNPRTFTLSTLLNVLYIEQREVQRMGTTYCLVGDAGGLDGILFAINTLKQLMEGICKFLHALIQ